jgi:hypothetical protein
MFVRWLLLFLQSQLSIIRKDEDLLFGVNNKQLLDDMRGLEMSGPITGKRIVGTQLTVESMADKCMDMVSMVSTDVENMRTTRVPGLYRMV